VWLNFASPRPRARKGELQAIAELKTGPDSNANFKYAGTIAEHVEWTKMNPTGRLAAIALVVEGTDVIKLHSTHNYTEPPGTAMYLDPSGGVTTAKADKLIGFTSTALLSKDHAAQLYFCRHNRP
jgi:hypothetical protein